MIEIIGYTGCFPNLCHGTLTIRVDGKLFELPEALVSGGSVSFGEDWEDWEATVDTGDWQIDTNALPEELVARAQEIEAAVNSSLDYRGCCGGCV